MSQTAQVEAAQDDSLRRSRRAAAGFRSASRTLDVLATLLPAHVEVPVLTKRREALADEFNKLTTLQVGSGPFEAMLGDLESQLSAFRTSVLELDGEIPMGWFREHFDAASLTNDAIADYAALLGRHTSDDLLRLDRVQLLLTRLVNSVLGMSPDRFHGQRLGLLLAEALPESTMAAEAKQAALQFFSNSLQQVRDFRRLQDLTSSGFFVDFRGYKLSLRSQILDPEVMASVIEVNDAVSRAIDRLSRTEMGDEATLAEHMAQVDAQIRKIFTGLRTDETAKIERFRQRVGGQAAKTATVAGFTPEKALTPEQRARRRRNRMIGVLVLAAALLVFRRGEVQSVQELSSSEVTSLSPVLSAAETTKSSHVVVGHVEKSKWALMRADERRQAAERIAARAQALGYRSVTVLMEEQVVVKVENGALMMVQ